MKAKPIISTPVMVFRERGYYAQRRLMLCAGTLMRLYRRRATWPDAIRLHAFARAAKGRKRFRVDAADRSVFWTSRARGEPYGLTHWCFSQWLLYSTLGSRLRAGETVTIYVELEVVEGPK